jgi:Fe-S-cluster-containing hydrogenase component 2
MTHESYVQMSKSRVKVYKLESEALGIPMLCEHCDEPPCILACPVNAISKDPETDVVSINVETCTGCKQCIDACPYSAIRIDPDSDRAFICDLCGGDPECAKACLPEAITWIEARPSAVWRKNNYADKRVKAMERLLKV